MFGVTNPKLIGPERTLKFSLYKLMGMRAASYVCELCPALYVPNVRPGCGGDGTRDVENLHLKLRKRIV